MEIHFIQKAEQIQTYIYDDNRVLIIDSGLGGKRKQLSITFTRNRLYAILWRIALLYQKKINYVKIKIAVKIE